MRLLSAKQMSRLLQTAGRPGRARPRRSRYKCCPGPGSKKSLLRLLRELVWLDEAAALVILVRTFRAAAQSVKALEKTSGASDERRAGRGKGISGNKCRTGPGFRKGLSRLRRVLVRLNRLDREEARRVVTPAHQVAGLMVEWFAAQGVRGGNKVEPGLADECVVLFVPDSAAPVSCQMPSAEWTMCSEAHYVPASPCLQMLPPGLWAW